MVSQRPRHHRARKPEAAGRRPASRKLADAAISPPNGVMLGAKLRLARERRGVTVREMARRIGMSPSLVSQIERGLATPSVGTLWSMTTELSLIMDELFSSAERSASAPGPATGGPGTDRQGIEGPGRRTREHIQRGDNRKRIRLAGGVEWERLTAQADDEVEFLYVRYKAGAESCPPDSFLRHGGKEYAYVLDGRLGVQIGFDRYELGPGDSISFQSQNPHRLWAIGKKPATAIWVVVNRTNDNRE